VLKAVFEEDIAEGFFKACEGVFAVVKVVFKVGFIGGGMKACVFAIRNLKY
jgi:hypothetical protein